MYAANTVSPSGEGRAVPWNKGKLLGQRPPLKLKEIWAIRSRLQLDHRTRELALFNLAIDGKPRGCDLVSLRVHDVVQGSHVAARAIVMQKRTQRPVQFELTEQTGDAVAAWIGAAHLTSEQFLFPSRVAKSPHRSTRQYSRMVGFWVGSVGLDPADYGPHSLRRTKPTVIYRRTKNLRAVLLLLGYSNLKATERYITIDRETLETATDNVADIIKDGTRAGLDNAMSVEMPPAPSLAAHP
jgi:site-specific recombinase XerC